MNYERYILSEKARRRRAIVAKAELAIMAMIGAGIYALTVLLLNIAGVA